jgi:hypothetical protein
VLLLDLTDEDREALTRHLREPFIRLRFLLAPCLALLRAVVHKRQPGAEPARHAQISRLRARWHRRTRATRIARRLSLSGLAAAVVVSLGALGVDRFLVHERGPATPPLPPQGGSRARPIAARDPLGREAEVMRRTGDPEARTGDPEAEYQLAMIYAKGPRQDLPRAVTWFRKAADAGMADAQYDLATLYASGLGVPADMQQALKWYRLAAAQNHPLAQYNLAVAQAQGRGIPQNPSIAAKLFLQAAEQGVVPAMVNLAILYQQGKGVATSPVDSYAWYEAAAEHGDAEAQLRAAALLKRLSWADKRLANKLATAVVRHIRALPPAVWQADRPVVRPDQPAPALASGLAPPEPDRANLALPTIGPATQPVLLTAIPAAPPSQPLPPAATASARQSQSLPPAAAAPIPQSQVARVQPHPQLIEMNGPGLKFQ